jgi:hypothetical protein
VECRPAEPAEAGGAARPRLLCRARGRSLPTRSEAITGDCPGPRHGWKTAAVVTSRSGEILSYRPPRSAGRESNSRPPERLPGALPENRSASARSRRSCACVPAAVVSAQTGTALPTELPEHEELRAGLEPATCRVRGDNRTCFGPQQCAYVAVMSAVVCADSNRRPEGPHAIDNRAAPARDDRAKNRPTRIRTRACEVGARRAAGYTTGLRHTPGWSRTSDLCRRRAALSSAELRACVRDESLRQESNPHLGRTKGACCAVDTTEALNGWRRRESNPLLSRCKRGALPQSFVPEATHSRQLVKPTGVRSRVTCPAARA